MASSLPTKFDCTFFEQINIPELQRDLQRKHHNVGNKVAQIWQSFTVEQRETAVRLSTGDIMLLRHPNDPQCAVDRVLAVIRAYMSEYNLRDMSATPDHLLDMLNFRTTSTLQSQLSKGVNGAPGDHEVVQPVNRFSALTHKRDWRSFVHDDERYGQRVITKSAGEERDMLRISKRHSTVFPYRVGNLILLRQSFLFQFLNLIFNVILDLGSQTRSEGDRPKKSSTAVSIALAKLDNQSRPQKATLPELIAQATEQKSALEDYFSLLRDEAVVLNYAVRITFLGRAEFVADERGRNLPMLTDKYLSVALFASVNDACKVVAIWGYIVRLLEIVASSGDRAKRVLILQELSNTLHLEYRRAQLAFQNRLASPFGVVGKRFKRVAKPNHQDKWKVVIKGKPADSTVADPHLHYILRLCHPDTSPAAAVDWIRKLDDHILRHGDDHERLTESQVFALGDLAVIVSLMQTMSTTITLPHASRKVGLLFSARLESLETELTPYKYEADFTEYVAPMNNLLEPGIAARALTALSAFVVDRTGASFGSLYGDIVEDSLCDLESLYIEAKSKAEKNDQKTTHVPLLPEVQMSTAARIERRKEKEKTRPHGRSTYDIAPALDGQPDDVEGDSPAPRLTVSASTASTFTTLFAKSEARGSVAWTDFEAAMAELGFSVTPKGGSILTFNPLESIAPRPITLHRPHGSEIEGYKLLYIARRLQRAYRWDAETFQVK